VTPSLLPKVRPPKGRGGRDHQNALRLYEALSALRPEFRTGYPAPSDFAPHAAKVGRLCGFYAPSTVRDVASWVLDGVTRRSDPTKAAWYADRIARVTFAEAAIRRMSESDHSPGLDPLD
jgi:hypothetical protein